MKLHLQSSALALLLLGGARLPGDDAVPAPPPDPARPYIEQAVKKLQDGDVDGAGPYIDRAVQLNPRNVIAHVLRGTVAAAKQNWTEADAELSQASDLAPTDPQVKLLLADEKFSAKKYDDARTVYVGLRAAPDLADLATFSVYLCDLYAGHQDLAAKELAVFREHDSPAFYFAHGAERLYHHDVPGGKVALDAAVSSFPQDLNGKYAQQLRNAGYLPLPLIR